MIIKAYRFAAIADLRQVKEGTVRLQPRRYTARLAGCAEFVAEIVQELPAPI